MDAIDELLRSWLSDDLPPGDYVVDDQGDRRVLWKISEGEPLDGALDPAPQRGAAVGMFATSARQ